MSALLQLPLVTSGDVATARQLTRAAARESGLGSVEQAKLATAISELARRCLASSGAGEVSLALERAGYGRGRLVVKVLEPEPTRVPVAPGGSGGAPPGLDLASIGVLVDDFGIELLPGGARMISAAMRLGAEVVHDLDAVARRVAALQPNVSPESFAVRNQELADALTVVEAQSAQLALANEELGIANDALSASATRYRQLADQQTALAYLGELALASRDTETLAADMITTLRGELGVSACAVLKFADDRNRLVPVAHDGCEPAPADDVQLSRAQSALLSRRGVRIVDLTSRRASFPVPAPRDARRGATVLIQSGGTPWGVIAACAVDNQSFGESASAFMESAALLLALSNARAESEQAATHASLHDALTGLPNRPMFLGGLADALEPGACVDVSGDVRVAAVIFVDLDGFKEVNDRFGHLAGDEVLVETAARLLSRTRPDDTLARLGGDEFVAICQVTGEEDAAVIAQRLVAAFDEPFVVDDIELMLSASAGYALTAPGVTASHLLADADIAMYRAKKVPGSTTVAFRPEMRGLAESEGRLHNELRRALERGQIRPVYQPIVDLDDGRVCAVETLLRWRHPEFGEVSPPVVIAAAERIGLTWPITLWILGKAARDVRGWNEGNAAHLPVRLAVNFLPSMLDSPTRIVELMETVEQSGLPLSLVDIEITETASADPTPGLLNGIEALRGRGMRLAMDDFGTGYSTFLSLTTLPFDILKIDRSFVTPLDDPGNSLLVSAMTWIAQSRGLRTVGEGVETRAQLGGLIEAGCDFGQGFLFSRPLERQQLSSMAGMETRFVDTVRRTRLGLTGSMPPGPAANGRRAGAGSSQGPQDVGVR